MWDASVLLASWLATDPTIVAGRNILELGAGCGAVGLSCAALSARHVALTDFDAGVVELPLMLSVDMPATEQAPAYERVYEKGSVKIHAVFEAAVGAGLMVQCYWI